LPFRGLQLQFARRQSLLVARPGWVDVLDAHDESYPFHASRLFAGFCPDDVVGVWILGSSGACRDELPAGSGSLSVVLRAARRRVEPSLVGESIEAAAGGTGVVGWGCSEKRRAEAWAEVEVGNGVGDKVSSLAVGDKLPKTKAAVVAVVRTVAVDMCLAGRKAGAGRAVEQHQERSNRAQEDIALVGKKAARTGIAGRTGAAPEVPDTAHNGVAGEVVGTLRDKGWEDSRLENTPVPYPAAAAAV
jgi:hypothetical protein